MFRLIALWLLCFLSVSSVSAAKLNNQNLPDALKPWIPWVLQDSPDYPCPFFYNNEQKQCQWSGALQLALRSKGGTFATAWTLYQEGWLELPGDSQYWPQQVTVNKQAAVVIAHNNKPSLFLPAGQYDIGGEFFWERIPERLTIPQATGLVNLSIENQAIAYPAIKNGLVWLKERDVGDKKPANIENRVDLQVFRKVLDDVPLQLTTHLSLDISGNPREIKLPHALLLGFVAFSLSSPLPARLENDGSLLLQVRPGRWQLEINARHPNPLNQLDFAIENPDWPEQEIWVFQAMPYQRLVEIEQVEAIDPSQSNLPPQWQALPAYQLTQGQRMVFKTIRRGDPEPEPNQLNLNRQFWLDFDGQAYTVKDQISGKMTHDWRLNALPSMQLGQAKLDGQNQLVTQQTGSKLQGVEVRKGVLQLEADSRIVGAIDRLDAVGWQQTFHQVHAEFNLPPGWRLFAASGVDNDPNSWIAQWTLLDLFLVLIAALSVSRLWNRSWGAFALVCLVLIWHEADAPRWVWLNLLATIALLRVLPDNPFAKFIRAYRNLCWLVLVAICIPFMISQVRAALYPQLERDYPTIAPQAEVAATQPAAPASESTMQDMANEETDASSRLAKRRGHYSASGYAGDDKAVNFNRIDPDAKLQTGPGLPQWEWRKFHLSWNGAVDSQAQISLWYLPPPLNVLLNVLRVVFIVVLSLRLADVLQKPMAQLMPPWLKAACLLPLLLLPIPDSHADIPDAALLEQLKARLLQPAECLPECATIATMQLRSNPQEMAIELKIHAPQAASVPLPALAEQWFPNQISVDGAPAKTLLQFNNHLWLALDAGIHNVQMRGLHTPNHKFTLPLPLIPRYTTLELNGWHVEGVQENGVALGQLAFSRIQSEQTPKNEPVLQQNTLPPFIRIERTLKLGLDWRLTNRVVSLIPNDSAVVLAVPLLKGEAIMSPHIRSKDGHALIQMSARQNALVWESTLDKAEQIELKAANTEQWTESWRVDASPLWHLEYSGIAAVHHQDGAGQWLPEWRPWPGESVTLNITRPQAVSGSTLTIDKSQLQTLPGKRSVETTLQLSLRSSKAAQHTIKLPENAVLQTVLIDGATQPIRQKDTAVSLPIRPGTQEINLSWLENTPQTALFTSPQVDLGIPSVNSHINITLGTDRWVMLVFGPKLGPAALIWGVLVVLLILAYGLGKVRLTPLKHWQWFLLLLGLSQIAVEAGLIVVCCLIALGFRANKQPEKPELFNLMQIGLAAWSLLSVILLFTAVYLGCSDAGAPNMQISGNGSTAFNLNWYQDRSGESLPTASVVAVSVHVYRALMLIWSFWMSISLLRWAKWAWGCFSVQGLWKKVPVIALTDKRKASVNEPPSPPST